MTRKHRKRHAPKIQRRGEPGAAPGTVIVDPSQPKPDIDVIAYGAGEAVEMQGGDRGRRPRRSSAAGR